VAAIESPIFQPAFRIITSISNSENATITTSFDHDYKAGLIVSFRVPKTFGMKEMNNLVGNITVTGPMTFTVNINTLLFRPFLVPVTNKQSAQVLPIAEISDTLESATENVLPFT